MSRWIDADKLMAELQKDADAFDDEADDARKNSQNYTDGDLYSVMGRADGIRDAMMEIYDAPSIDIVRCKDCKHGSDNKVYGCSLIDFNTDDYHRMYADDYCSYGERNTND